MVRNFVSADGSAIACGETAEENDELCRRAKSRDLWFHLDGQPSAHVILSVTAKAGASRSDIHDAQQVLKYYSARGAPSSRVIYVEARAVSGSRETKAGSVTLGRQPTKATVVYDEATCLRLLASKH
jgi:predicted ribosome quality control (RQC) complex YloA/Tae2 family protein